MPKFDEKDLDAELVFDRFIGAGLDLDVLQSILSDLAPTWSSKLRVWRAPRDQRPIDVGGAGALKSEVVAAAGERGELYRALVERYGSPPLERMSGSAELRGAGPELVVVVSLDEMVLSPLGVRWELGNSVALQVRRPKVERRDADDWLREAFESLCASLSPAWAAAGHPTEYWAKVMSDGPGVEAVGRDFGRYLPGVFWLNFFGRRYRDLVGEESLRSSPAASVAALGDGVLVRLAADPLKWDTPEYASDEQTLRDHLGAELFFSKAEPARPTVAPDWGR